MKITLDVQILEETEHYYRVVLETGFGNPTLLISKDRVG